MRILINTVCFYPNIGGLETMNMILAKEFVKYGHNVIVLAPDYPNKEYDDSELPFKIVRNASMWKMFSLYLSCDVYFHSQISLKAMWPFFLWPMKKWYCSYHMCEFHTGTKKNMQARLKYFFSRLPRNIAVSHAVAHHLNLPRVTVIYNAYNDKLFVNQGRKGRRGFVYVGRLVSVKGIFILLEAFKEFAQRNPNSEHAILNIIGDGNEKENIKTYIEQNNLKDKVFLSGALVGAALVDSMNKAFCQVVPSTYNEAFGIVALEAMGCGCIPLVSDGDGLQEAVGNQRFTFKKADSNDLLKKMESVATMPLKEVEQLRNEMAEWCKNFTPEVVAKKYLDYLQK